MKQAGQEDMYVTVPEAGGHNQTFALNYRGIMRDFDGCAWSKGNNAAIVYKNRAVLDCLFRGRGIDFRPNQSEVGRTSQAARKKRPKQEKGAKPTDSHVCNITVPVTRRQSTRLVSLNVKVKGGALGVEEGPRPRGQHTRRRNRKNLHSRSSKRVRRAYSRSCGRCQTPCKVPPSPRRLATNCSLSSITEHSFQGIPPSPLRGESVGGLNRSAKHLG